MRKQLNPPLPNRTHDYAKLLRGNSTEAERKLWYYLRAGRLQGLKFRRQHPIPSYVVDFYCEAAHLIVELDGSQHSGAVDAKRSHALEQKGMRLLRFWDNDVLEQTNNVLNAILSAIAARTLTPRGASRA